MWAVRTDGVRASRIPLTGWHDMDLRLRWHSFLIPGVFFTAIGVSLLTVGGLGPLSLGSLAVGYFLSLAAVLQALEDREETSASGREGDR
jgi:membrane protein implicated in regulation of membrane protease activity